MSDDFEEPLDDATMAAAQGAGDNGPTLVPDSEADRPLPGIQKESTLH